MIARLPLVPTVFVLAAVTVMMALGFWQLERRGEKAAMLERYAQAVKTPDIVRWPAIDDDGEVMLYRRARLDCETVSGQSSMAGTNASGRSGLGVTATCLTPAGDTALVVLGWSNAPVTPDWPGGEVVGVIGPGPRLVADPPLAGLEANAIPDPSGIPDNHLLYALQWFFFAAAALVIYGLAVRKRLAGRAGEG